MPQNKGWSFEGWKISGDSERPVLRAHFTRGHDETASYPIDGVNGILADPELSDSEERAVYAKAAEKYPGGVDFGNAVYRQSLD